MAVDEVVDACPSQFAELGAGVHTFSSLVKTGKFSRTVSN
jgi:hypothetical protein